MTWEISIPEEDDTIDSRVFVCDKDGNEVIEINCDTLANSKRYARTLVKLLNESNAELVL